MNALNYLDFEKPIVELLAKIEELKHVSEQVSEGVEGVDLSKEIALLNQKDVELTKKIFKSRRVADLPSCQASDAPLYQRLCLQDFH